MEEEPTASSADHNTSTAAHETMQSQQVFALLTEYTDRCRALSEEYDDAREKHQTNLLVTSLVMAIFFLSSIVIVEEKIFAPYLYYIGVPFVILLVSVIGYTLRYGMRQMRDRSRRRRDIDQVSHVLDKIVRRASQLHSNRALTEVEEFTLEIKLAEAEVALRMAKFTAGELSYESFR